MALATGLPFWSQLNCKSVNIHLNAIKNNWATPGT